MAGAVTAVAIAMPYLLWQGAHGWPQIEVGRAMASGSSGTSEPRTLFVPLQLLFIGPLLTPVWIVGLVAVFRRPQLRAFRFVGVAFILFALLLIASGGKPYYLAAMYPPLIATGSDVVVGWCKARARQRLMSSALLATAALSTLICLPVLPARDAGPVVGINYDAGETIGWPTMVNEIAALARSAGPADRVVVLTDNYGEAGAIDLYGPARGVPAAYSGHNGFGYWPPARPAPDTTFVVVGMNDNWLAHWFAGVSLATQLDNRLAIDNDEQATPVWICHGLRRPWPAFWSTFQHLG